MNYSNNPRNVRVDFFKPSGKWYETEQVTWTDSYDGDIIDSFRNTLHNHLKGRLQGMIAVCLQPYHEHSHPLMITIQSE